MKESILITGGTGSLGQELVRQLLPRNPRRLIIFSRDEWKQGEMRKEFPDGEGSPMRYFIGDVRDFPRLATAMNGVDFVIHAAALKQVPSCEYNPAEAVKTNILGAMNVIGAAIEARVSRVLAISTDKAVYPINLYGATKMCAEKLLVQANVYASCGVPAFGVVRYGNVLASRGSVVGLWEEEKSNGNITVTDEEATRFWITLPQAARFVIECLPRPERGLTYVPKLPSVKISALADAYSRRWLVTGLRPGEKRHETLITEEESRRTVDFGAGYAIYPELKLWEIPIIGRLIEPGAVRSDTNTDWIEAEPMRATEQRGMGED